MLHLSYTFVMEEHISDAIERIHERNARVEADKAWEQSLTRIASVAVITYLCAAFVLWTIGIPNYLLSAMVPVIGFVLSTQSLPSIKAWWVRRYLRKK